jgi:hypothetical protein
MCVQDVQPQDEHVCDLGDEYPIIEWAPPNLTKYTLRLHYNDKLDYVSGI